MGPLPEMLRVYSTLESQMEKGVSVFLCTALYLGELHIVKGPGESLGSAWGVGRWNIHHTL